MATASDKSVRTLSAHDVNVIVGALKVRRAQLMRAVNSDDDQDMKDIRMKSVRALDVLMLSLAGQADITY